MGLKNLKSLYAKSDKDIASDNKLKKLEINQLKDLISKKLNDPEMAKKAAQIISEMINPSKK